MLRVGEREKYIQYQMASPENIHISNIDIIQTEVVVFNNIYFIYTHTYMHVTAV